MHPSALPPAEATALKASNSLSASLEAFTERIHMAIDEVAADGGYSVTVAIEAKYRHLVYRLDKALHDKGYCVAYDPDTDSPFGIPHRPSKITIGWSGTDDQ